MNKNGWTKSFDDGQTITNVDGEKTVSWSGTRLDGIDGVEACFDDRSFFIAGKGEYHQSDDFTVSFNTGKVEQTCRRVQLKLDNGKWLTVENHLNGGFAVYLADYKI